MSASKDRGAPRPPITLPENAKICVNVDLAFEGFHTACQFRQRAPLPNQTDHFSLSFAEYGLRVGIWRLLDALEEWGVPATCITSGLAAEVYAKTLKALHQAGHEVMAHAWTNDANSLATDDEQTEAQEVARSIDAIRRATGEAPVGWMSPGGVGTPARLRVLAAQGILYNCDDASDDLHFVIQVGDIPHVVYPRTIGCNDLSNWLNPSNPPSAFLEAIKAQFDQYYAEGVRGRPACFDITLHAHMAGRALLMPALHEAMRYILGHRGVWVARKRELAQWILDHPDYHG